MCFTDILAKSMKVYPAIWISDMLRYLIPTVIVFVTLYVIGKQTFKHRKIQTTELKFLQIKREFFYSILSVTIFAFVGLAIYWLIEFGFTQVYVDIQKFGWIYFVFSIPMYLILHDAYFYFTHRLLHTRYLFKNIHKIHHQSHSPSPWAAYAFHPVEAFINALFVLIVLFFVPIQPTALFVFLGIQITRNVLGHSGYEVFPKGFTNIRWLGFLQTNTEHDLHHRFTHGNFSLYFTWWDHILKTKRHDSISTFNSVTDRRRR